MAKLIFTDLNHDGRVYELTLEKTTVGPSEKNTLTIADASLSAQHCEILVNGAEVIVRDLGSRNGTYINGARLVNHQSQLMSGQTVRFGSVEARLELDGHDEASGDTASEITAVHAMGRIMREQKKARENPTNASMKLESPGANLEEYRTVTAHDPPGSVESPAPAPPPPAENEHRGTSKTRVLVIPSVIVLGLLLLLWLGWGGK